QRGQFPFVGLVVSGGHTSLFYVRDFLKWQLIGATRDDAAGESFDKVAKILQLGYPGGPIIEKMAQGINGDKVRFPRSYLEKNSLDFSFSGLKTAVLYYVRNFPKTSRAAIAAGFQEAVIDVLAEKALRACLLKRVKTLVVGGGVAVNRRLRELFIQRLSEHNIRVYFPQSKLCQDNAAMVAGLGYQLYKRGVVSDLGLQVAPNLTL
ncbi:MAG: hypothetical protein JW714_04450, partial [Candidatus Omnitrophica bacterium]|nr:hypothetical protein [Candidatus Omnitrophota bacterium]